MVPVTHAGNARGGNQSIQTGGGMATPADPVKEGFSMLDIIVWMACGWFCGVAVSVALGIRPRRRLAWGGFLGGSMALLSGWLLAPAFHMPQSPVFSLAATAVAVSACIILCLLGHLAGALARRSQARQTGHAAMAG